MKKSIKYLFVIIIVVTLLGSCDLFMNWFGTTIEGRVDAFDREIKGGDITQYYTHFHSDTQERSTMKNQPNNFGWGILDDNAEIINYSVSGETVSGTMDSDNGQYSFSMEMKKDGLEYYILTLDIGSSYEIRKLQ